MTMFVIQSAILLAIAFVLGCVVGALLHRWFGEQKHEARALPEPEATITPDPVSLQESAPVPVKPAPTFPRNSALDPKSGAQARVGPKAVAKKSAVDARKSGKAQGSLDGKDDLKRIRGVGRQNEAKLNKQGITSYAAIAGWTKKDQAEWGERLAFPGRIEREKWVSQAKTLAKGDSTEFSRRAAKGLVPTSAKAAKSKAGATRPAQ